MRRSPKERFQSKVKKTDGCWIWIGAIWKKSGYGAFHFGGSNTTAHRAAWILAGRKVSRKKDVCHTCDNRPCVRLSHLFRGTRKQNINDSVRKGRFNQTKKTAFMGEGNPRAKLQAGKVLSIRRLWKTGRWTLLKLASRFNVCTRSIWKAATGLSFQNI
jgi:hypothetical protein